MNVGVISSVVEQERVGGVFIGSIVKGGGTGFICLVNYSGDKFEEEGGGLFPSH